MTDAGRAFLQAMPDPVARQRHLLDAILRAVEGEPALRWFELGCSLGRGAGDELSDVDCAVGVDDGRWPDALDLGDALARADGAGLADRMVQAFPGRDGRTGWHQFTLYDDGAQLSLVLMPASWRTGRPPGSVALYDADGRLATPTRPASADADPATTREWAALGWIALGDLAKYLDRGSLWEAYQRLGSARDELWKLSAAGSGVDFPGYGLTAILDEPDPPVPPDIEATVATLDPDDLRRAARALAALLTTATGRLDAGWRAAGLTPPDGLRAFASNRLGPAPP